MTQTSTAAAAASAKKNSTGFRSLVETTREFIRISKLNGGLVPQSSVPTVLGVSRQRIHQLIEEGTFSHWTFYGMKWLSQNEVISFGKLNRQPGENQHTPSAKQLWKESFKSGKEFVKKRDIQGGS